LKEKRVSATKELDALVIRNIADIEAAMNHAKNEIGPRIWEQVAQVTQETCDAQAWLAFSDVANDDVWFAHQSWLMADQRKPRADFWIGLDERLSETGEDENSWVATFVASGPNGATMAFWLKQQILGAGAWKKLVKANHALVAELRGLGFAVDDDDDRRLYLPVVLDRELLARSFETEDFDVVMEPARIAVANATKAAPVLVRLRELALAAAS
jgi:hypothetical protein